MKEINPTQKMWRTLVRVIYKAKYRDGVVLMIPGFREGVSNVFCPRKAIPPAIYDTMEENKRYHVGCNRGAESVEDICFDGWENQ